MFNYKIIYKDWGLTCCCYISAKCIYSAIKKFKKMKKDILDCDILSIYLY